MFSRRPRPNVTVLVQSVTEKYSKLIQLFVKESAPIFTLTSAVAGPYFSKFGVSRGNLVIVQHVSVDFKKTLCTCKTDCSSSTCICKALSIEYHLRPASQWSLRGIPFRWFHTENVVGRSYYTTYLTCIYFIMPCIWPTTKKKQFTRTLRIKHFSIRSWTWYVSSSVIGWSHFKAGYSSFSLLSIHSITWMSFRWYPWGRFWSRSPEFPPKRKTFQ